MEIKRTPRATGRAVEQGRTRSKWPWLLVIIILILVLLAALLVYFVSLSRKVNESNTASQQEESTSTAEVSGTPAQIATKPAVEEMFNLIFARPTSTISEGREEVSGNFNVYSVDSAASDLEKTLLGTLDASDWTGHVRGELSPNGQFAYFLSPFACAVFLADLSSDSLTENKTFKPQQVFSCNEFKQYPEQAAWLPDSSGFLFNVPPNHQEYSKSSWLLYDLTSGQTKNIDEQGLVDSDFGYLPVQIVGEELFALRFKITDPLKQTLGVIKLEGQAIAGKFEKIITAPDDINGAFVVSDDGQLISWTRKQKNSGNSLALLELLDRATGEIKELRKSGTADYSNSLFNHAGTKLYYTAASGLWSYDLESGKRNQIIDESEVPDSKGKGLIQAIKIRPDDGALAVRVNPGGAGQTLPLALVNLGDKPTLNLLEQNNHLQEFFLGWQ